LLFLWGDCVTMDTINKLESKIFKQLTCPGKEQYVRALLTVLKYVIEVQGDLHLGMHMLAVIFKRFYPAVIQVVQAIVRFKRIQLNPL